MISVIYAVRLGCVSNVRIENNNTLLCQDSRYTYLYLGFSFDRNNLPSQLLSSLFILQIWNALPLFPVQRARFILCGAWVKESLVRDFSQSSQEWGSCREASTCGQPRFMHTQHTHERVKENGKNNKNKQKINLKKESPTCGHTNCFMQTRAWTCKRKLKRQFSLFCRNQTHKHNWTCKRKLERYLPLFCLLQT